MQESNKFLVIMARFSALSFTPVFSASYLPSIWKVFFTLLISLVAWMAGVADAFTPPMNTLPFILVLIYEIVVGIALALFAQFTFAGIQLAGQLLDTQMGFGIMNVVDPLSGIQAPLLGNFKYMLAVLVFLVVDGHLLFLQALFDSYRVIPIGEVSLQGGFAAHLIKSFGGLFVIGFKVALPITGSLLFAEYILGIMAKTVPQMNIFMVGMPAKILLSFVILLVIIPLYIYYFGVLIEDMFKQIYQAIRLMI